jgi:hypothetical protein
MEANSFRFELSEYTAEDEDDIPSNEQEEGDLKEELKEDKVDTNQLVVKGDSELHPEGL